MSGDKLPAWAGPSATAALFALSWECLGRWQTYPAHLFPPPSEAARALADMWASGELLRDAAASGRRWFSGLLLGNLLGLALGVLTGSIPWARRSVGLLLNFLRTIPFLLLVPFAMLWFGLGELEKIAITAWGAAFPVWLNVQTGIVGVEQEYVWAARCLGASGLRLVWEVHLKRCLAYLVAGTRLSIATGTFALVAAEMSGAFEGLGFRVFYSYQMFQTDRMMAGVLLIAFLGLTFDRVFVESVRRLLPWSRKVADEL